METFPALLAICAGNSPVSCEFPAQRPVMRSFNVFFDLHLNKRFKSKQSSGWWFETPSHPLCHQYNGWIYLKRHLYLRCGVSVYDPTVHLGTYCKTTWFPNPCLWFAPSIHIPLALQWRHNEHDGVSYHQRLDCLLKYLFRHRSKKILKLHWPSPVTGGWIPHTKGQ